MRNKITYVTDARSTYFINLATINDVKLYRVTATENGCRFSVNAKDDVKIRRILTDHGKECQLLSDYSVNGFIKRNAKRIGLYVGLVLVAALLTLWTFSVTEIRVSGNELVKTDTIIGTITETETFPAVKKNFPLKTIKQKLIALDGISSVALEIKGNVLYVTVLEELESPNVVDYNEKDDVTAKFDGMITRIVTYAGTAKVAVGDTVKKGQTLISHETVLDDGEIIETRAMGDVYGRIWISENYVFTPTVIESKRTGNKKTYVTSSGSTAKIRNPFASSEYEEEEIFCFGVFPLRMKAVTYYETEEIEREFDFEAEQDALTEEKIKAVESRLPADCEKIRSWYSIKTVDKNVVLDIYYEVIVKIN